VTASEDLYLASVTKDSYLRIIAGGMVEALQEKLDFLRKVPALRGMDNYALRNLSLGFHRLKVLRGSPVYTQGQDSDSVYLIHKGQCCVTTTVTAGGVPPPPPPPLGTAPNTNKPAFGKFKVGPCSFTPG